MIIDVRITGWSLGSYRRAGIRSETPPGYDLFYYKDKGTKTVTHMIDFQEYGVTKKWVIITEISKEVENNSIARINVYTRQYVPRSVRGGESPKHVLEMVALEDHIEEVVVLDVLDSVCVYLS